MRPAMAGVSERWSTEDLLRNLDFGDLFGARSNGLGEIFGDLFGDRLRHDGIVDPPNHHESQPGTVPTSEAFRIPEYAST